MDRLQEICEDIAQDEFSDNTQKEINNYLNDIQNGTDDILRFKSIENSSEQILTFLLMAYYWMLKAANEKESIT